MIPWASREYIGPDAKEILISTPVVEIIARKQGLLASIRSAAKRGALILVVPSTIKNDLQSIGDVARRSELMDTYNQLPKIEPNSNTMLDVIVSEDVPRDRKDVILPPNAQLWGMEEFMQFVGRAAQSR